MSASTLKNGASGYPVDLPELSLESALQLEKMLKRRAANKEPIMMLAGALGEKSGFDSLFAKRHSLHIDPLTSEILNRTFSEFHMDNRHLVTLDDLEIQISEIIQNMMSVDQNANREKIAKLKDFCLSLHEALLGLSRSQYDENETFSYDDVR